MTTVRIPGKLYLAGEYAVTHPVLVELRLIEPDRNTYLGVLLFLSVLGKYRLI
ncbi:hypothetical protein AMBR_FBHANALA_01810 [Dolosigranulum pigrum]|nr:hypothetical protein AMBR_FBHANALA_01810 [Dolosigranulum pigrum]